MIQVTVKLIPSDGGPEREIATMEIENTGGTKTEMFGNYGVVATDGDKVRNGRVAMHMRQLSVWRLVERCLQTLAFEGGINGSTADELRGAIPCPYCGENPDTDEEDTFVASGDDVTLAIECWNCLSTGPVVRKKHSDMKQRCVELWNRRSA